MPVAARRHLSLLPYLAYGSSGPLIFFASYRTQLTEAMTTDKTSLLRLSGQMCFFFFSGRMLLFLRRPRLPHTMGK